MLDVFRRLDQPFQITFEASTGYGWMYEQLSAMNHCQRIVVAHPGAMRLIFRAKRKNDRIDAKKLAKLLWIEENPSVYVPFIRMSGCEKPSMKQGCYRS